MVFVCCDQFVSSPLFECIVYFLSWLFVQRAFLKRPSVNRKNIWKRRAALYYASQQIVGCPSLHDRIFLLLYYLALWNYSHWSPKVPLLLICCSRVKKFLHWFALCRHWYRERPGTLSFSSFLFRKPTRALTCFVRWRFFGMDVFLIRELRQKVLALDWDVVHTFGFISWYSVSNCRLNKPTTEMLLEPSHTILFGLSSLCTTVLSGNLFPGADVACCCL